MNPRSETSIGAQRASERLLSRWVSIYRYFSYMVAVGLMVGWSAVRGVDVPARSYVVLGVVGVYVVVSTVAGFRYKQGTLRRYALLAVDEAIAVVSLLLTGGLDSGLLLYSLAPILSAALVFEMQAAFSVTGVNVLAVAGAHVGSRTYSWILDSNYLAVFLLYAIAAALVALVPYLANVNLVSRLRREAMAEERRRLRRDLHDNLAQELGFLNLRATQLRDALASSTSDRLSRDVIELQETLQRTFSDVRGYLDLLSTPVHLSFRSALEEMVKDFSARSGVAAEISLAQENRAVSPMAEAQVLAIMQEALRNVHKHSQASRVRIALAWTPSAMKLVVEDNGRGFDPPPTSSPGHFGLMSMQERAREIGGTITIESARGRGTQVQLLVPV